MFAVGHYRPAGEEKKHVNGGNQRHRQADIADGTEISQAGQQGIGDTAVEKPVGEKQPGGKGVFENCRLKKRTQHHDDPDKTGGGTGTFGLPFTKIQQSDREPHNSNGNQ